MSVSDTFRRIVAANKPGHVTVTADSRMDKWARARGADLVESVVTATRRVV
jgi:hypothetical protein